MIFSLRVPKGPFGTTVMEFPTHAPCVLQALAGEFNAWVAQNEIDKVASGVLWIELLPSQHMIDLLCLGLMQLLSMVSNYITYDIPSLWHLYQLYQSSSTTYNRLYFGTDANCINGIQLPSYTTYDIICFGIDANYINSIQIYTTIPSFSTADAPIN